MFDLSLGAVILSIVFLLIILGVGQRVLDRLYLSDRAALILIGAILVGSLIDIPLAFLPLNVSVNVGGGLIPFLLALYILVKAGTARERMRAITAAVITAIAVIWLGGIFSGGHTPGQANIPYFGTMLFLPLVAGVTAYIFGRSRRGAYIAATLGALTLPAYNYFYLLRTGITGAVSFGGAGIFDIVILSGLFAVVLAEVIGEVRERWQGGPTGQRPPSAKKALSRQEISEELGLDTTIESRKEADKRGDIDESDA